MNEDAAVRVLARFLGKPRAPVMLGIGDDAAILRPGKQPLVWTLDACVEGTHFRRDWLTLEQLGYKSLAAAVSDIAAMGARPIAALAGVVWPGAPRRSELAALARGQAAAGRELGCPIVGGNLGRGRRLEVTTSVLGRARRPLVRSGARPGDELWLVGELGLAAAGVALLGSRAARRRCPVLAARRCIEAFRRPRPLIGAGLGLGARAHAAIDVSDGLVIDTDRLAAASGVRIVLEKRALERTLPRGLDSAAQALGRDPFELMLRGGEDYALVAAGPERRRPRGARRIGHVERGSGVWLDSGQRPRRLSGGWDHFAR